MSEIAKINNNFIGYEYKEVTVKCEMELVYADGYINFGWIIEDTKVPTHPVGTITMKLKRDRKLRNKTELSRLQRQFESCVKEVQKLEFSKILLASSVAYIIGVIGTAFMAGAVFSYLANMLVLCIILAIPAFTGWIIPYFIYCILRKKKTDEVESLIEQKYDEIYKVCEKANGLLN